MNTNIKEKEELIKQLKFEPTTVTVGFWGWGGSLNVGKIKKETYEYFQSNQLDIGEYVSDWDNEMDVPENLQPFYPGQPYDCNEIYGESGVGGYENGWLIVTDSDNNEIFKTDLCEESLKKHGIQTSIYDSGKLLDQPNNSYLFLYDQEEKGCFWEGELHLSRPLDPSKFLLYGDKFDGRITFGNVDYDNQELDNCDEYDTRGKYDNCQLLHIKDGKIYDLDGDEWTY